MNRLPGPQSALVTLRAMLFSGVGSRCAASGSTDTRGQAGSMTILSLHPDPVDSSPVAAIRASETIGDIVRYQSEHRPQEAWGYLLRDLDPGEPVRFGTVRHDAERVAGLLQELGVRPGDRVLIMLPTGLPILHALFGTWLAGAVAVPTYPPFLLPAELLRALGGGPRPSAAGRGAGGGGPGR